MAIGEESSLREEVLERQVRRVATSTVDHDMGSFRPDLGSPKHLTCRESAPGVVERRKTGHAMKVRHDLDAWKSLQFGPAQLSSPLYFAEDPELEGLEIVLGRLSIGQHRPFVGLVLARGYSLLAAAIAVVHLCSAAVPL